MINDEDVVAVRDAVNIVGVISETVPLKRVGRRWVGLCPFHTEKSPSFSVNEEAGLFYCFGCQKKGDAITFLRELEGLDFVAAVERLAAKANVPLRYTDADGGQARRRRHHLSEVLERAVDWYHERLLRGADAGPARGYLRSRGIGGDEVRRFRLGWAPEGWDELARALRVGDADWRDSGLGLINRRGRQQDFFRGRILFPIFDPQGDAIGFGGRKMQGADGPKYLNPGGTPIYDKSKVLYGLSEAKADIVQVQEAIICEGYTDVIGFFQAGMGRAVATCGTALTEDHVKLLTRFAKRLVLAFDADSAGQAAAERFHQWEQSYDLDVAVAALPPGVDPADLARSDRDALREAVERAVPFLAFRLQRVFAAADLQRPEGRARAAERALEVIAGHPNPLIREQYLLEVASHCRVEVDRLRPLLESRLGAPARTPADRGERAGRVDHGRRDERPRESEPVIDLRGPRRRPVTARDEVERDALRVAVESPDEALSWLDPVLFADGPCRRAFSALVAWPSLPAAVAALEHDDPEAAELLLQAVAEQSDASMVDVFLRLSQETARRVLVDLRRTAMTSDDPLAFAAATTRVAGLHATLLGDDLHHETKVQAGTDLLAWLLDPGEGTR